MSDTELSNSAYSLLVVDDTEMNRDLLTRRLTRHGYQVHVAEDGHRALALVRARKIDLILLDIMMPGIDGYQVLGEIKSDEALRHIPVIMITALDEMDSVVRCIEMGAEDYLPKPFNPVLLRARVQASLEKKRLHDMGEDYRKRIESHNALLNELVEQQVRKISSAQLGTIFAMSKLAESRDPETGSHLERMREYCKLLSQQLADGGKYRDVVDEQFVTNIYAASPLHDIGKVGVPDHILRKPGKLTDEEWVQMKFHSVLGAETLRAVDSQHPGNAFIAIGIEIAESHHEKWNGNGYPNGLAGESIPLPARILALGDVYDALTSKRCYKPSFTHEKALEIIAAERGAHFDPAVVDAFQAVADEFQKIRLFFHERDPV